jgi:DnaK suppressor protein
MDKARAQELLANERARLERLLRTEIGATAPDQGDEVDDANWRIAEETGRAVSRSLRDRWSALERAEERLARGAYGRSVLSGKPIPEERLEADPLAELTVEEAASEALKARYSPEPASSLSSTRRTLAALVDRDETSDEAVGGVSADDAEEETEAEDAEAAEAAEAAEEVDVVAEDADIDVDELEGEELIEGEEGFEGEDEETEEDEVVEVDEKDEKADKDEEEPGVAAEERPRRGRRGR